MKGPWYRSLGGLVGSALARESGVQGSIPTRSNKTFSLE